METVFVAIITGAAIGVLLFVLWWVFIREEKFAADVNFVGNYASLNQLSRSNDARKALDNQVPGELDSVFYPPPAIDPRLQSVQYEHVLNPDINFDIDYQRKNDFPLVKALSNTSDAYVSATTQQVALMKNLLHQKFDGAAKTAGISSVSFDSSFRNLTLPTWKPAQRRADILASFLAKLSDDIFDNLQTLFSANNVKIASSGAATPVNTQSSAASAQIGFMNKSNFTVDSDGLVAGQRVAGKAYSQAQLRNIASKFVISTYNDLLNQYQYELNDVPRSSYQSRVGEVEETGNDLVDELFSKNVSAQQLDDFTEDVKSSMEENLFEIMIDAGVDPSQFQ